MYQTSWIVRKICTKNEFYVFVPNDLDLWHFNVKFALPLIHGRISVKFEVLTTLRFRVIIYVESQQEAKLSLG